MPLTQAEAALVEARVRTNEWVAAQEADRRSAAKRKRFWRIVAAVAVAMAFSGLGYLIGVEGKRAIGLAAFVGFSAMASTLVWGVWEIERDE